ncbi:hypothetical protein [Brumimicrobium salinarum]|nr:hypothetical protein [Brumimicrobium salinarum]
MKKNKFLQGLLVIAIIIGLFAWGIFLSNSNTQLKKVIKEEKEKFHYLDAYNKVIEYDLTTARDSVRILREKIEQFKNTDTLR